MSSPKTLVLFDVDGTLAKSQNPIEPQMDGLLQELRKKAKVGLVGGSDLSKIVRQLADAQSDPNQRVLQVVNKYDYVFAENGLVAYKEGSPIGTQNIVEFMGEEKLQKLINFCLKYMSELELPLKRGNFVEFRSGLINICPIGRSCSQKERDDFGAYDAQHKIREKFVAAVRQHFGPEFGMTFAIGGQISFDCFPNGWDKTFCLQFVEKDFDEIHFFGDKTYPGGNDHEIFADPRTVGHSVTDAKDTERQIRELFF